MNSRENQLTPWSNDPVSDPVGEAIYLRDDDSGEQKIIAASLTARGLLLVDGKIEDAGVRL